MRRVVLIMVVSLIAVLLPSIAAEAHVERPSYWPDPKPDCTIPCSPCAGGEVPTATHARVGAGRRTARGDPGGLPGQRLDDPAERGDRPRPAPTATTSGRPTIGASPRTRPRRCWRSTRSCSSSLRVRRDPGSRDGGRQQRPRRRDARALRGADRTVAADVRPGVRPVRGSGGERRSRSAEPRLPVPLPERREPRGRDRPRSRHRRRCRPRRRTVTASRTPEPCIRCNLQLEGSGVSADDVIVEAGDASAGNGGPSAVGHEKDVGIFVDRADGFVLRNVTVRHAREHDIYVLETDGYLLDRFKTFYAGAYGVLTFVEDHGVMQNCEAAGNGDSGLYPGSGAETMGSKRYKPFYPTSRFSQVVRWCDSHHNTGGFSGTDSHGTLITENNFYDNALGYTTDVFTAPGHPGFPQHSNVVEENNFYGNNFNPFEAGSDVEPFIPAPVGTGLWIAGGNAERGREQPLLRQLAARRDALRGAGRPRLRSASGGQRDAGARMQPARADDVVQQQVPPQHDGRESRGRGQAERQGLLVGLLPDQHGQLLVGEHRCPGQEGDQLAEQPARVPGRHGAADQHRHQQPAQRGRAGRLLRRVHLRPVPRGQRPCCARGRRRRLSPAAARR